jgi:pimeloyl-ACP methyl ester carboxylesterase
MRPKNRRAKFSALKTGTISFCFLALLSLFCLGISQQVSAAPPSNKPTVVLVHGAFADSSSWNGVAGRLLAKGYPVVAVANPLRGLQSDAKYVAGVLDSIPGPIILVGHSYGGNVITNAAAGRENVKALVYVAGLAPDSGESAATLSEKYPGKHVGPDACSSRSTGGWREGFVHQTGRFSCTVRSRCAHSTGGTNGRSSATDYRSGT